MGPPDGIPGSRTRGYFDYAASAPPYPEALRVFRVVSEGFFGNPSSTHRRGMEARERLETARTRFAELLGAPGTVSVLLTSGATEANNFVLRSTLGAGSGRCVVAADVHPSSWFVTRVFSDRVDPLPVDGRGAVDPAALDAVLSPEHRVVSVVHAGNETGRIHDVEALRRVCLAHRVLLHVDGVQAVGKLPLGLDSLEGVFYTFSAHKFGAPRGSGGVVTASPERLNAGQQGGGQERGLRAGTENTAAFAAAVAALEQSLKDREARAKTLAEYAAWVTERIGERFPWAVINSSAQGLPGLVSVSVRGLNAVVAVTEMAIKGFDVSSGSACHSGLSEPSRVIRALGRDRITALGTLRISMGYATTREDVEAMVEALLAVIERGVEVG